jgi:hypothetical protein
VRDANLVVALAMVAGCETQRASVQDAAPSTTPDAPAATEMPSDTTSASTEASAHAAHWEGALTRAMHLPCRAIAADGVVRVESQGATGVDGGLFRVAHNDDIPDGLWLSLGQDARLVAKDPRTTRETTFVGPARVRPCVLHREESWIAAGGFESEIGAGETPGAEEWVVTPQTVVRYLAAKLRVDVLAADTTVSVGSGDAFVWQPDDVHDRTPVRGRDAGAPSTQVDDEGWYRVTAGAVKRASSGPQPAAVAARAAVERCGAMTKRSQDLAAQLLSGSVNADGGAAKEQLTERRLARAACAVAAMRVGALDSSASREALAATLNAGSLDR